jgi:hypothetical protein
LRLQKIGNHYRAIRRYKTNSNGGAVSSWKANDAFGIAETDVEMEERWKVGFDDNISVSVSDPFCSLTAMVRCRVPSIEQGDSRS